MIISKGPQTGFVGIEHATGSLKKLPGRGLPGKRAKLMPPVTTGPAQAGKRRLGGGYRSQGLLAKADTMSAFGVDHGFEVSKASATVSGRLIEGLRPSSPERARYLKSALRGKKPQSGAHERALNSGAQRLEAIAGRQQHRANYPGSKNLHGFPKRQLP
jgi:hypothetical protein